MASEHGLNRGRGHLPAAYADDIETGPSLHEVSFDPVFGPNLWVEVLTDRVSESRAARLSPAVPPAPLPGDGGRCRGETGLSGDGVAVAVGQAEVVQQAGHIEEFGVVFQSDSLRFVVESKCSNTTKSISTPTPRCHANRGRSRLRTSE